MDHAVLLVFSGVLPTPKAGTERKVPLGIYCITLGHSILAQPMAEGKVRSDSPKCHIGIWA